MSRPFPEAARRAFACACAATILCAANARADDGVELYGLIGSYFGSIKHSDKIDRTTQVGSGGLTTSWWGVRGSEDLGGDVKAIFELEQFFQPDTGGAGRSTSDPGGFSRNGFVGLAGSYGQLTIGRQTSPYYLSMQMVNPFGASVVFSPLVVQSYVAAFNNTLIGDNVWNNVIQYASPTIKGFSANITYAPGEVAGNASVNNASINLHYIEGPLTAVLSAQRIRTAAVAPSTGQEAYLAGFAYDFRWAKFYAAAQRTDNAVTDITSRTWELGTRVPALLPTGAFLFSWAHTNVDNPAMKVGGHDTASLGYDYFMSRRTDVYAMYTYDHNQGQMVGNSYAVGIRHSF